MDEYGEAAGLGRYPLARRGFVMTGLISGLTMATTRVDAQAIHTDTAGLIAGETQVPVADGHLPAYYARPAGDGPFGVVLVIEEIFPLQASVERTEEFIEKSRPWVDGCLSFYWGKTVEENERKGDLTAALVSAWLKWFQALAPAGEASAP